MPASKDGKAGGRDGGERVREREGGREKEGGREGGRERGRERESGGKEGEGGREGGGGEREEEKESRQRTGKMEAERKVMRENVKVWVYIKEERKKCANATEQSVYS